MQSMLEQKIIERSDSDIYAPVVHVKKSDGSFRFCINYKKFNIHTKFDNELMSHPEEILTQLAGKIYFSKFDFINSYG